MENSGIFKQNLKKEHDEIQNEIQKRYGPPLERSPWQSNQISFLINKICELRAEIESLKGKIREPMREYKGE